MAVRYETPPPYQDRLHIQTISYCNASCLFCAYPAVKDRITHGIMEDGVYKKIIDEASHYNPKRVALLLIAVLAAVVTPTPDPVNMALVMAPLILLYGLSIVLARMAYRPPEEDG